MGSKQFAERLNKVGTSSNPVPSINTEQLINGLDGGDWETLKDAGFEQDDILVLETINSGEVDSISTTSTTYVLDYGLIGFIIRPDRFIPDGVSIYISYGLDERPGADETLYFALHDKYDDSTINEESFTTINQMRHTPWTEWAPADRDTGHRLIAKYKTTPGANSSNIYCPTIYIGVKL